MVRKQLQTFKGSTSSKGDDFSCIKGIGLATQKHLHDAGILTFAQLGATSPKEIANLVTGRSAKHIIKENWIDQARKLAQMTPPLQTQSSEAVRELRQHYATFTVELLLDEDNSVRRTRAAYVQDKTEETWVGWEKSRLADFFVRGAGLKIPLSKSSPPEEPISKLKSAVLMETIASPARTLKTSQGKSLPNSEPKDSFSGVLRASQLETIPLDSKMPQQIAHANEAFNVHILLDLTEVKATPSKPLNCAVTIWAKKLGKGERQIIGEQQSTFMPVEKIPRAVESTIPSPGIYRLEALVTLTPESISPLPHSTIRAWLEGSLLQIY